jgi:hypothetical protein
MDSSRPGLSRLQRDLLREFFARERRFVLTGGGALVGYYLKHRTSEDLDLFGKPPLELADARRVVEAAASVLGASIEPVRAFPEFQRLLVRRGQEECVVDLVVDRAPDVDPRIEERDGVRLHSLREIAANKICALLGRSEIRDLVDLHAILQRGFDLAAVLADAERKDAGASAATLAWVLDSVRIGADAKLPGGVDAAVLDRFRADLVRRLRALAKPLEP